MTNHERRELFKELIRRVLKHLPISVHSLYRCQLAYVPQIHYKPASYRSRWRNINDPGNGCPLRLFWHQNKRHVELRDENKNVLAVGSKAVLLFDEGAGTNIADQIGELELLLLDTH